MADTIQYVNNTYTKNEQDIIKGQTREMLSQYSIPVTYFRKQLDMSTNKSIEKNIYGSSQSYYLSADMNIYIQFGSDTDLLQKFGISNTMEAESFFMIDDFTEQFRDSVGELKTDLFVGNFTTIIEDFSGYCLSELYNEDISGNFSTSVVTTSSSTNSVSGILSDEGFNVNIKSITDAYILPSYFDYTEPITSGLVSGNYYGEVNEHGQGTISGIVSGFVSYYVYPSTVLDPNWYISPQVGDIIVNGLHNEEHYEISHVTDKQIEDDSISPLLGHYVFRCSLVRKDPSHELFSEEEVSTIYYRDTTLFPSYYDNIESTYPLSSIVGYNSVNIISGACANDMTVSFTPAIPAEDFKNSVRYLQSNDVELLLYIGGSQTQVDFSSEANIANFVQSVTGIVETYGFDGIDIGFETSGIYLDSNDTDYTNPTTVNIINCITALEEYKQTNKKLAISCYPEYTIGGFSEYGGENGCFIPILYALCSHIDSVNLLLSNVSTPLYGLDNVLYDIGTKDFIIMSTEMLSRGFPINRKLSQTFNGVPQEKLALIFPATSGDATSGFMSNEDINTSLNYLIKNETFNGTYVLKDTYTSLGGVGSYTSNSDMLNNGTYINNLLEYFDFDQVEIKEEKSVDVLHSNEDIEELHNEQIDYRTDIIDEVDGTNADKVYGGYSDDDDEYKSPYGDWGY